MTYQEQVKKIYGERSMNALLEAVDHGHVEVKHALDISNKLDPRVGGKLRHRKTSGCHFEWNRSGKPSQDVCS